jgi:hypothetical protein
MQSVSLRQIASIRHHSNRFAAVNPAAIGQCTHPNLHFSHGAGMCFVFVGVALAIKRRVLARFRNGNVGTVDGDDEVVVSRERFHHAPVHTVDDGDEVVVVVIVVSSLCCLLEWWFLVDVTVVTVDGIDGGHQPVQMSFMQA